MNCAPLDLAIVVRGLPRSNIGKVIRVIRLCDVPLPWHAWEYEGNLIGLHGSRAEGVADVCLRPQGDAEGVEEMLIVDGLTEGEVD